MKKTMIKEIAKKVTATVMSSGPYEWPPSCILFTYQPVRPEQKNAQCCNMNTHENREEN